MVGTVEALIILIFFIAPGYIITTIINRRVNPIEYSEPRLVLVSLIYSIFNHIIVAYWTVQIYIYYKEQTLFSTHITYFIVWTILTAFIVPLVIGTLLSLLLETKFLQNFLRFFNFAKENRIVNAWDYIFLKEEGNWIIVHLKSGDKIYGKLGKKSFISLLHENHDIYLEELYNYNKNDDSFNKKFEGTNGAWISSDDISWISFWNGGEDNGKKRTNKERRSTKN